MKGSATPLLVAAALSVVVVVYFLTVSFADSHVVLPSAAENSGETPTDEPLLGNGSFYQQEDVVEMVTTDLPQELPEANAPTLEQPKPASSFLPTANPSAFKLGPLDIVPEICAVPTCTRNGSTKLHTMTALRVTQYLPRTENVTLPSYHAKMLSEMSQKMKIHIDGSSNRSALSTVQWCSSSLTVMHFLMGHYHVNLMHTLFRSASVQLAVHSVRNAVSKQCPELKHSSATNIDIALVPRYLFDRGVGPYYVELLSAVEGSARTFMWPPFGWTSRGEANTNSTVDRCTSGSHCMKRVLIRYDYIGFFDRPGSSTRSAFRSLREGLSRRWNLHPFSTVPSRFTVLIVNRRKSRRIKNVELMRDHILAVVTDQGEDNRTRATRVVAVPHRSIIVNMVEFEDMPLPVQAQHVRAADVVIAVHGAACAWALLMSRGAHLVEILPPGWSFMRKDVSMFALLSDAAELASHTMLQAKRRSGSSQTDAFSKNFTLKSSDIQKISRLISERALLKLSELK